MTIPATAKKARQIGPYSRPNTLAKLDRRTREARLLEEARDALTTHVGGVPSVVQIGLIERAAWLSLHIALLDRKVLAAGQMTDLDQRTYLSWTNALARTLSRLGLRGAGERAPTLRDYLRSKTPPGAPS